MNEAVVASIREATFRLEEIEVALEAINEKLRASPAFMLAVQGLRKNIEQIEFDAVGGAPERHAYYSALVGLSATYSSICVALFRNPASEFMLVPVHRAYGDQRD